LAILAAALPLLSGCIAVAALPLMAGGAMFAGGNVKIRAATPRPKPGKQAASGRTERTAGAETNVAAAPISPGGLDQAAGTLKIGAPPSDEAVLAQLDPWRGFFDYARRQAGLAGESGARRSVLLDPAAPLTAPRRRDCQTLVPAVVIDLDKGTAPFDPAAPLAPPRGLAGKLAELREAGIVVTWVTAAPATKVGAVADALRAAGLDPAGTDPLLLVRSGSDRKQALRQEANRDVCVIAIAGDRKGDFDELFDYLRDPRSGDALDYLIGAGWFIVPPPLQQRTPDR
jgi:hypothetical protein